jgi:hypothetical protein
MAIARRDHDHPPPPNLAEELREYHGIRDVRHLEFVYAKQRDLLRQFGRDLYYRIPTSRGVHVKATTVRVQQFLVQFVYAFVYLLEEGMEMNSTFLAGREVGMSGTV